MCRPGYWEVPPDKGETAGERDGAEAEWVQEAQQKKAQKSGRL